MSELSNGHTRMDCEHDPEKMDDLIDAVKALGVKLDGINDSLSKERSTVMRWLLATVCIIAIGSKALDLGAKTLDLIPKVQADDTKITK